MKIFVDNYRRIYPSINIIDYVFTNGFLFVNNQSEKNTFTDGFFLLLTNIDRR